MSIAPIEGIAKLAGASGPTCHATGRE